MHKYGLKLWSINKNYVKEAAKLFKSSVYQFIELYAVPGSFDGYISDWQSLDIPFVIHASHYPEGMNLAKRKDKIKNINLMDEARKFADALRSNIIIVHPGTDGTKEEIVSQLSEIKDRRIIIENKPYDSLYKGLTSNGNSPEEIKYIMDKTKAGFCLDMGHAVCSANSHKIAPITYLEEFIALKPVMYHISDGDFKAKMDSHQHFGTGNFPINELIKLIPSGSRVTIETVKDSKDNLTDFIADVDYLKELS